MSTRLDLINSMLATTGTASLSAADETHPSYIIADRVLSEVVEEFSSRELWFNTSVRTLSPNPEKFILVPSNALSCDPTDASKKYAVRGQYLFDLGNYTFEINESVACTIVTQLDLEFMPPIAIQFVRAHARLQYFIDQEGSGPKLDMYRQKTFQKDAELISLNMKHTDTNFFNGSAYAHFSTRRSGSRINFNRR
jgi:hypothetical protein